VIIGQLMNNGRMLILNMNKCLYLEETNNSNGQDCECMRPDYGGYNCEYYPIFKGDDEMYNKCLEIENVESLIYIQLGGNQTEVG
jgi:hypothetical protein